MKPSSLLVDTDVFIDYFNLGAWTSIFDSPDFLVHYSVVTEKELLARRGLSNSAREHIIAELRRHRAVGLNRRILERYSALRETYPRLEKEDALIAASALVRRIPLLTRNRKHFSTVAGLRLAEIDRIFPGRQSTRP